MRFYATLFCRRRFITTACLGDGEDECKVVDGTVDPSCSGGQMRRNPSEEEDDEDGKVGWFMAARENLMMSRRDEV